MYSMRNKKHVRSVFKYRIAHVYHSALWFFSVCRRVLPDNAYQNSLCSDKNSLFEALFSEPTQTALPRVFAATDPADQMASQLTRPEPY